jgi:hypothetical protein
LSVNCDHVIVVVIIRAIAGIANKRVSDVRPNEPKEGLAVSQGNPVLSLFAQRHYSGSNNCGDTLQLSRARARQDQPLKAPSLGASRRARLGTIAELDRREYKRVM